MATNRKHIADNLVAVRGRIADAAGRAGRDASAVTLVAVTKYVGVDAVRALIAAGCLDLGESRPQELWNKAANCEMPPLPGEEETAATVRWHMIGHLQRNKVRRTLPTTTLIHSADSLRLLRDINRVAGELRLTMPVLLEVNVSGDEAKHGFATTDLDALLPVIGELPNVRVRGLMAMASLGGDLDGARGDFARLRQLRDRLRADCPSPISLDELSMGMSRDFEVAIEEGATMVRVGSALFEGLES